MPNTRKPRSGSLQFWPRKQSKRKVARTRTYPQVNDQKLTGFAGYKIGMTHVQAIETNKHSHKKGEEISVPVTMIECPPLKIASLKLYKKESNKLKLKKEVLLSIDKNLNKRLKLPKKDAAAELDKLNFEEYDDVRVLVYTQPQLTATGQKKPEVIELGVGGSSVEDKVKYVKENIGKDVVVESVFQEGDLTDIKSITKGKGFQGPVKRFGISIRQHKSEKAIRNPGSLGPWCGQGHIMWRVAHAGKMGYHQRTEYNKQILLFNKPELKNGLHKYGKVKNQIVMIKGSVGGSKKRLIVMQKASRIKKQPELPTIEKVNIVEN